LGRGRSHRKTKQRRRRKTVEEGGGGKRGGGGISFRSSGKEKIQKSDVGVRESVGLRFVSKQHSVDSKICWTKGQRQKGEKKGSGGKESRWRGVNMLGIC